MQIVDRRREESIEMIFSAKPNRKTEPKDSWWFFFTMAFLFVDYIRPQHSLPIRSLRPALLIIIILSFYIISNRKLLFFESKQTQLIWCFIALTAIYIPLARNNRYAFGTTKVMFALYMPFILSTVSTVNSIKRLKVVVNFLILCMCYISIYSLTHGGIGPGNYFNDENDLALFIDTILPFCYFLLLYEKSKMRRMIYGVSLVIGILAVTASFSRGGFIGLICMITIAWWFSPRKIISLVVICILMSVMYFYGGQKYIGEITTATDAEHGTGKARIESWKSAWKMFLDNPLGVGGNNFQVRFPEYQTEYFGRGMWGRVAHSIWFTLLAELGIVGVYIYLSLLFYNLKDIFQLKGLRKKSPGNPGTEYLYYLSLSFLASFAGYFASGTFLSVLYYPHYWYLTAILVATRKIAGSYFEL